MARFRSDKLDIGLLATELESTKHVRPDGEAEFRGFHIDELSSVLETALEFDAQIPPPERYGIVNRAIFTAARGGTITKERLLAAANRLENDYLALPLLRLQVYTTFVLAWPHTNQTIRMPGGCTVSLLGRRPARIVRALRSNSDAAPPIDENALTKYQPVKVLVTARTPHDAIERATDAIDFMRGLWNWRLNRRVASRLSTAATPVNQIRVGPYHTVHDMHGDFAAKSYWIEPAYVSPPSLRSLRSEWEGLRTEDIRVRRLLRPIPYAAALQSAFVRYARALDSSDHNATVPKLWGVLELLTGTKNARYEQLISRCCFVFENPSYARALLEHLRERRNSTVHHDAQYDQAENLVFQLKRFVEALFKVHLGIGKHFATITEVGEFFDLPADKARIRQRLRTHKLALRFLIR